MVFSQHSLPESAGKLQPHSGQRLRHVDDALEALCANHGPYRDLSSARNTDPNHIASVRCGVLTGEARLNAFDNRAEAPCQ